MDSKSAAAASNPPQVEVGLVPTAHIERDPDQIRRDQRSHDGQQRLKDLEDSVREYGLLQPVILRHNPARPERFVLIAGGRRLTASGRAGLAAIPAVIRPEQGLDAYILQLEENVQRQDLEPIDQGRAYVHILDDEGWTVSQLAQRLHCSEQHVRETVRIFRDHILNEALTDGRITKTVAREINKSPDEVKEALRWRLQRGDSIAPETLARIRDELKAAGITNPRYTKPTPEVAKPETPQEAAPPAVPPQPKAPRLVLDESEPMERPTGPQLAGPPRPDPFDAVRKATDEDRDVPFGDPEHIVVEPRPSRYGRRILAPEAPKETPAVQPTSSPSPSSAEEAEGETGGISALNRADAESDDHARLLEHLLRLDWEPFKDALLYGVERGWSCASLYSTALGLLQ